MLSETEPFSAVIAWDNCLFGTEASVGKLVYLTKPDPISCFRGIVRGRLRGYLRLVWRAIENF